jgi:hypothetical protein
MEGISYYLGTTILWERYFDILIELNPGDEVILFTEQQEFHYRIQKIRSVSGAEQEGDRSYGRLPLPNPRRCLT